MDALPPDPFAGDPFDPASALDDPDAEQVQELDDAERADVLADLKDLAVYRALLEPRGIRGIVVDCIDCQQAHYHDWDLLQANLRQLLQDGRVRPHEPACDPDPSAYASWDYCRGYADAVMAFDATAE